MPYLRSIWALDLGFETSPCAISSLVRSQQALRLATSSGSDLVAELRRMRSVFAFIRVLPAMNSSRVIEAGVSAERNTPESSMSNTTLNPIVYSRGRRLSGHACPKASMQAAVNATLKGRAIALASGDLHSSIAARRGSSSAARLRNVAMRSSRSLTMRSPRATRVPIAICRSVSSCIEPNAAASGCSRAMAASANSFLDRMRPFLNLSRMISGGLPCTKG